MEKRKSRASLLQELRMKMGKFTEGGG